MEEKKDLNQVEDLLADLDDEWGIDSIQFHRIEKKPLSKKTKLFIWLFGFLLVIAILLQAVYLFLSLSLKPSNKLNEYEKMYLNVVKSLMVSVLGNTENFEGFSSKDPLQSAIKLKDYIKNPWVVFYDKLSTKEQIQQTYFNKISKNNQTIKKYQDLLAKYKFFPKELQDIVKDIRLLPILTALNSIKVYVTDYVYIKSWLFSDKIFDYVYQRNNVFVSKYSISKLQLQKIVENDLQYFKDQGTYLYLQTIYFNYMYFSADKLADSYLVNMFSKVFEKRLEQTYEILSTYYSANLSKEQFLKDYISLIKAIYQRTLSLEQQSDVEILPVDVQLLSYNPQTKQLSFSIKLMLSPDLSSKVSPVNLLSNIVNLLRESRLIIGKTIKYNNVKVKKVAKKIGGYKLTFNSIDQTFTTLVQQRVDVEVTDSKY